MTDIDKLGGRLPLPDLLTTDSQLVMVPSPVPG
jgi:hypothetical protein